MEAADLRIEREWQERGLWVGARLLASATAFFFLCFVFAYFYLRSLDVNGKWKIGHVSAPIGFGVAIVVALVLSAVVLRAAARRPGLGLRAVAASLVLGLAAVALQCIEYTTLGFGPASGGYASVFVGWTTLYAVAVLGTMYWVETQLASGWRARRAPDGYDPAVMAAGLEACSFFWAFLVAIGGIAFVLLYLL